MWDAIVIGSDVVSPGVPGAFMGGLLAARVGGAGAVVQLAHLTARFTMTRPAKIVLLAFAALPLAASAQAESRGELLYTTHCIACHTAQVHWRDQKLATNWSSLKAQVRRWQAAAQLGWSDDDILEVTRHLNERFYRFTPSSDLTTSPPFITNTTASSRVTSASGSPATPTRSP